METYFATLLLFLLAVTGLSLGVIFKGKQIKGHCGGGAFEDKCIRDSEGNKIESCSDCSCESERI
jgi:hypothetical protein